MAPASIFHSFRQGHVLRMPPRLPSDTLRRSLTPLLIVTCLKKTRRVSSSTTTPESWATCSTPRKTDVYNDIIKNGEVPPGVGAVKDDGSFNRYAFKSISRLGVCKENNTWPFGPLDPAMINGKSVDNQIPRTLNDRPNDAAYSEAKAVKVVEYCRLDPDHPDSVEQKMTDDERIQVGQKTLQNLKQCLTEGYPAVIGFNYYWEDLDFAAAKSKGYPVLTDIPADRRNIGPGLNAKGEPYGGHTVLAIGYDDSDSTVLIQNSWGPIDDAAFFKMPYSWITDWEATNDFWMVREMV